MPEEALETPGEFEPEDVSIPASETRQVSSSENGLALPIFDPFPVEVLVDSEAAPFETSALEAENDEASEVVQEMNEENSQMQRKFKVFFKLVNFSNPVCCSRK